MEGFAIGLAITIWGVVITIWWLGIHNQLKRIADALDTQEEE